MSPEIDAIIVRRAEERDIPALEAFYRRHHPGRTRLHDMAIWRWEFVDNPNAGDEIPFFILECDGEAGGGIGYVPVCLRVGEKVVRAGHPVNFFIDERFRGLPALRLLRAVLNDCPVAFSSYVSDDAARLLKTAGFVDLSAQLEQYYLPLYRGGGQHGGQVGGVVPRIRSAAIQALRKILEQAVRGGCGLRGRGYRVESGRELPAEIPDSPGSEQGHCAIVKDGDYLRWRYARSPALDCLYVQVWKEDTPQLLAIVHLDPVAKQAVLMDVVRRSPGITPLLCLLPAVIEACRAAGADVLSTIVTTGELAKAMKLLGFSHARSDYRFLVFARDRALKKELADPGNWHFILGDTDRY